MSDTEQVENNNQPVLPPNFQALQLTSAIKSGNLVSVQQLLVDNEFDINAPIDGGWTPFMVACFYCQFDIMVHLLNLGAEATCTANYFTCLMAACSCTNVDEENVLRCVRFLINQGIPINERDAQGMTALMMAAKHGHTSSVSELIGRQSKLDVQDNEGWSALFHAVLHNRADIVKTLIENEASVKLIDKRGRSVIELAEIKGLRHIIDLFPKTTHEEIIPAPRVPINTTPYTFKDLVRALPGNEDFIADVVQFLINSDLDRYSYSFYSKKVNLKNLLTSDEEELKVAGVYLSDHRKQILNSIKRFHLSKWGKNCFGSLSQGKLQSDQIAYLVANASRHLYTLTASLAYLKKTRKDNVATDETNDLILKNVEQLNLLENRLKRIKFFGEYIEKFDKITQVDLITEKTTPGQNNVLKHIFCVYVPSTILTIVLVKNKNSILEFFSSVIRRILVY